MRARQLGMSLVELMVAVAIGMIGIVIIMQAYIMGDNFNRSTLGEGGAQTNGLIALYSIERDARMAGYGFNTSTALGCDNIYWYYSPTYSANVTGGTRPNVKLAPLLITFDTATPANPDQITILYSREGERMMPTTINAFTAASSSVSVDGTDGFKVNDFVVLMGGAGCTLGKVTDVQTAAQKLILGSTVSQNPSAWGSFPVSYSNGDSMVNLGSPALRNYLIGNGKLRVIENLFSTGSTTPIDLVDNVVDMRALYGKDANNDGIVDSYDTTTPTTAAGWGQVLAVKIALLTRAPNYEKKSIGATDCDATTTVPAWSGSTVAGQVTAANAFQAISVATNSVDRCYRYRVFETTVPLRNMIWKAG